MRRIPLLHTAWFLLILPLVMMGLNYLINNLTGSHWGDYLATAYFALYGIYCLQNFTCCREFHCAITGPGFLLAAVLMILRDTGSFDHGFVLPYLVFGLALAIGYLLEWGYARRTGSHFLR